MNQNNPFKPSKPKKQKTHHASFIEALKNIGSGTVQSFKNDVVKASASDILNSTISPNRNPNTPNLPPAFDRFNPDQFKPDWLRQQEQDAADEERKRQRLKEVNLQPIYDRREEEIKAQIKALREELAALAKDLGKLGTSVQKAIEAEIEQPGTYHVNFFEKLKKFIIQLRKQVSESANWLEVSNQRKHAKRYYWGQVKKSGTKFMLSSERNMVTQTG